MCRAGDGAEFGVALGVRDISRWEFEEGGQWEGIGDKVRRDWRGTASWGSREAVAGYWRCGCDVGGSSGSGNGSVDSYSGGSGGRFGAPPYRGN